MLNFLPIEERKRLQKEYYLRLGSIAFLFIAGLFVIASVGLLPSYLREKIEIRAHIEEEKARQGNDVALLENKEEADKVMEMRTYLEERVDLLKKNPVISEAIQKMLAKKTPAITIDSVEFSKNILTIRGIAATRDDLISFDRSLHDEPFFKNINLPIASLAKNIDNDFTLELTLK